MVHLINAFIFLCATVFSIIDRIKFEKEYALQHYLFSAYVLSLINVWCAGKSLECSHCYFENMPSLVAFSIFYFSELQSWRPDKSMMKCCSFFGPAVVKPWISGAGDLTPNYEIILGRDWERNGKWLLSSIYFVRK